MDPYSHRYKGKSFLHFTKKTVKKHGRVKTLNTSVGDVAIYKKDITYDRAKGPQRRVEYDAYLVNTPVPKDLRYVAQASHKGVTLKQFEKQIHANLSPSKSLLLKIIKRKKK